MSDFDPDAYLATSPKQDTPATSSAFDPDAYLSGKPPHDSSWSAAVTDIPTEIKNDISNAWDTVKHGFTDAPEPGVVGGIKNIWNTAKGIAALPAIPASLLTGPIHSIAGHVGENVSDLMRQGATKLYGEDKVKKAEEATGTPSDPQGQYESAKGGIDKALMALGPGRGPAVPGAMPAPPPADLFGVTRTIGEETGNLEAIRREQAAKRDMLGPAATKQATAFSEQRAQQLPAANEYVTRQLDPTGNGILAETPHDAAEIAQDSVQKEAARSKQDVTDAYGRAKQFGGELHPDAIKDTAVGVREDLNNLTEPVYVDDGTPVAARMLKFLDDRAAKLNIRNDADLSSPIPSTISGVNLEGVDQLRKGLSTMRGDALGAYGANPSDARAANAIMKAFDDRINTAVNDPTKFNGPPEAIQAWNDARALASQRFKTYGNDIVGKKIQAIIGDARLDKDPASLQAVSNAVYGGTGTAPSDMNIAVAKRLQKILGQDSPEWAALRQGYFKKLTTTPEGKVDFSYGRVADNLAEAIDGRGKGLSELLFTPAQRDMLREYGNLHRSLQIPPTGANWSETSTFVNKALRTVSEKLSGMIGAVIGHAIAPGAHGAGEYAGMQLASKGSTLIENAKNARMIKAQMPLVAQRTKQWQQAVRVQQRINNPATAGRAALAAANVASALSKLGIDNASTMRLLQSAGPSGPGTSDAKENPKGYADGGSPTVDDDAPVVPVTTDAPPKRIYMNMNQEGNSQQSPVPESHATLQAQQDQLSDGDRKAQLFPGGQNELDVPKNAKRAEMPNGDVFHYNPDKTNPDELKKASESGNENEVLGLGPYNKDEALERVQAGEKPVAVVERDPKGTEVRSAAGTDQTAPEQVAAMDKGKSDGNTVAVENPQNVLNDRQAPSGIPESGVRKVINRLLGTGGEERYQTWPERMLRSGATLAGDVMSGKTSTQQEDPTTGEIHTSPELISRAQDMAGLAGSGGLGSTGEEAGIALGSSPVLRPALKYNGKIYKAPPGGEHADAMPPALYNEYQKQALSGEDMSNFDFGFMNHKGQFLNRDAAMDYAVKEGLINPQAAKQGALTSTILEDSSVAGAPLAALEHGASTKMYHGSPHDFDKFDLSKIGSGEGAQEYGHGLYFSENPKTAESYRDLLKYKTDAKGRLYETNLKTDPSQFLDWDKHINEQPKNVQDMAKHFGVDTSPEAIKKLSTLPSGKQVDWTPTGSWLHGELFDKVGAKDQKDLSNIMDSHGVHGIKYLDELSRGNDGGKKTNNYVIFNEKHVGAPTKLLSDSSAAGAPLAALEHAQPFYSVVEKTVQSAPQSKMHGEQWANWLKNQPGVKPDELQYTGLDNWLREQKGPVTKQQVADFVDKNKVQINDVVKGKSPTYGAGEGTGYGRLDDVRSSIADSDEARAMREDNIGPTKYSSYQLPGGENYREHLLTLSEKGNLTEDGLPTNYEIRNENEDARKAGYNIPADADERWSYKTPNMSSQIFTSREAAVADALRRTKGEGDTSSYKSSHWDEPNILAHVRTNDRDVGGVPSMHLEEIQSDWGQGIRKQGVKKDLTPSESAELEDLYKKWQDSNPHHRGMTEEEHDRFQELGNKRERGKVGLPDMPFKTSWPELAMKRMIQKAALEGKNRISWTPGEAQAARYDLSKSIDSIHFDKTGDSGFTQHEDIESNDSGTVTAYDHNGHKVFSKYVAVKNLPDVIGKEATEKLMAQEPKRQVESGLARTRRVITNQDLKVGGEGMKGFYDQMLPKMVEKLGKQYGVKVKQAQVSGQRVRVLNPEGDVVNSFDTQANAKRWLERTYTPETASMYKVEEKPQPAWYFDIPPKMKEDVLKKGFPLFSDTAHGGLLNQNAKKDKQQIERPVKEAKTEPEINAPKRAAGGRVLASNIASPTLAQAKAGNYSKDHVNIFGMNLTIENAKGSIRRGIGPDGKSWACRLPAAYGYIKGSEGADGDHLDIYLGPYTKSDKVFVVNQIDLRTKKFDETKSILCAGSLQQALNIYCEAFSDGKGAERIGSIVSTDIKTFKEWIKSNQHHKPFVLKKEVA